MEGRIVSPSGTGSGFEWHAESRPAANTTSCGDQYAIWNRPGGALLALADGLGHGDPAHAAARAIMEALEDADDVPLETLFERTHAAARRTRGAALTLADIDHSHHRLTWAGVGNVEALLLEANGQRHRALLRGGVVGYRLPPISVRTVAMVEDALLVLATDGVESDFARDDLLHEPGVGLEVIARHLITEHGRDQDDATVVVVRYGGT